MFQTTKMDCQDWDPIKIGVRAAGGAGRHDTSKRPTISAGAAIARKIESSEDASSIPIKTLSSESKQAIIRWRVDNKQTQAQLNTTCSFPANTIRDIENGKLVPTPTQLNTLNRVLKMTLKYA